MIQDKTDAVHTIRSAQNFLNSLTVNGVQACMALANTYTSLNELADYLQDLDIKKDIEKNEDDPE